MNWRKPLLKLLLLGSGIQQKVVEIRTVAAMSDSEKREYQEKKLRSMIRWAAQAPYYRKEFIRAGVLR